MHYWLVKTEPGAFSYQDLEKEGWTHWDGVRNFQARNNLAAMQVGDLVVVYHSVTEKAIVGIAKVAKAAYPDPSDEKWLAVRMEPVTAVKNPISLEAVKADPVLSETPLVKQSRLSVMPLEKKAFDTILKVSGTKLK